MLYIMYIYIIYIIFYTLNIYVYIYISAGFSLLGNRGKFPQLAKNLLIHPAPGTICLPTKG